MYRKHDLVNANVKRIFAKDTVSFELEVEGGGGYFFGRNVNS